MLTFYEWMLIAAAVGGAAGLGWFFRGRRHLTERRIHAELFSRQVRLAEKDADKAIQQLNVNQIEMRSHQERFDAYEAEVERAQYDLQDAFNQVSVANKDVSAERALVEELQLELDDLSGTAEGVQRRALEAEEHGKEVTEARDKLDGRLVELTESLQEERGRAEVAETNLAELYEIRERESVEIASEREAERQRQSESEAALRRTLGERGETLAKRVESLRERERDMQTLRGRVAELQPLVEEVAESRAELMAREAEFEERALAADASAEEKTLKLQAAANERIERLQRVAEEERLESEAAGEIRRRELQEEAGLRQDDLQSEIERLGEHGQRLGEEQVGLREALDARTEELATRTEELVSRTSELTSRSEELATRTHELEELRSSLEVSVEERARVQAEKSELGVQHSQASKLASKLKSKHKSFELKLTRQQTKVEQLGKALAEKKGELKLAKDEGRSAASKVRSLSTQLERVEKAKAALEQWKQEAKLQMKTIRPAPKAAPKSKPKGAKRKTSKEPSAKAKNKKTGSKVAKKPAKSTMRAQKAGKLFD